MVMSKDNFDQFKYCIVSEFCYGCEIVSNKIPCVPHMNVISKKVYIQFLSALRERQRDQRSEFINSCFNTHVLGLNL